MIIKHLEKSPRIDESAYIAPNAAVCGEVKIGKNTKIMFGAAIIAEGGCIEIGDDCIVLENAVLRSTINHSLKISNNVLVGPNAHLVGCTVEDNVFIATGASIFHGAKLCKGSEVRINGVVHIKTILPENKTVPIGWVAVGNPLEILPPDRHNEIWAIQKPLNFPKFVYGVDRKPDGQTIMPEITKMMVKALKAHEKDELV
ncbi:carbonic anhydrase/acetyltransferase isoleucine patch superfamily-like protein [Desulfocucumis palustris]|uniref:Carbonic anhydrase/acetyltransferase isoleucine patch superfamily-like protein n=1 Tax=Desulfocucumis palustris TaxID=1898651 RepID=A0A2L2XGH4_9FIRM|nr:gamma carbonic anhydrase family protein [Desulfocucumis palustris]GBF35242.1 carbonic anhydrase/acetyltransferase isoleucine patch superfamily-like protein [Desulfocucumis palustris]